MGRMGTRPVRSSNTTEKSKYEEPALFRDVNTITEYARQHGLYDGNKLNLKDTISMFDDIKIEFVPMEQTLSGQLKFDNNGWVISINSLHNEKRQRFTLAHELGHYILHKEKNSEFKDAVFFRNEVLDSMEYKANEFASELLMPESAVRDSVNDGVKNIGELADLFGVSAAAMKYRILSLGYTLK